MDNFSFCIFSTLVPMPGRGMVHLRRVVTLARWWRLGTSTPIAALLVALVLTAGIPRKPFQTLFCVDMAAL